MGIVLDDLDLNIEICHDDVSYHDNKTIDIIEQSVENVLISLGIHATAYLFVPYVVATSMFKN